MRKQVGAVLAALGLILFCGLRVSSADGQRVVNFPADSGLHRWNLDELEQGIGGRFDAVCVSLPPDEKTAVLYLDGIPLEPYRVITREQAGRVQMFAASDRATVQVGLLAFPGVDIAETYRIRSINPRFS